MVEREKRSALRHDHSGRAAETARALADLADPADAADLPGKLGVVPRARERILDGVRAGIDRGQTRRADVERLVHVVVDLDGVAREPVRGLQDRVGLLRDRRGRVQVEQLLSKERRSRVVLGFRKGRHGETERELQVRGLEAAVRKVGGEFELTLERGRVGGGGDSSSLNLERESDEVLAADNDELLQLGGLRGGRRDDEEERLEDRAENVGRFLELGALERRVRRAEFVLRDRLQREGRGGGGGARGRPSRGSFRSGFRRSGISSGGREGAAGRYRREDWYTERKRGLSGAKSTMPTWRFKRAMAVSNEPAAT